MKRTFKKSKVCRAAPNFGVGRTCAWKRASTVREGAERNVLKGNALAAYFTRKMARLYERRVGYDRLEGEHASSATDRTLPGAASVCQLFSTLHEIALQTARQEKSALRLRSGEDPA